MANTNNSFPLDSYEARLTSQPVNETALGGIQAPRSGLSGGTPGAAPVEVAEEETFAGLGPLLEESDKEVYDSVRLLIRRQQLLADSRWHQDLYWTLIKYGYPWATFEKDVEKDSYTCTIPYGARKISFSAIPNKGWDLVNKCKETLLQDFPQPQAQRIDDSEAAEQIEDIATRFLSINGGEQGTNDYGLFSRALDRALVSSSVFLQDYVDPSGNGWVPLQIKAHPGAVDANNPLVGPPVIDPETGEEMPGMPTTDYVLRYVTPDGQFTNEPLEAEKQWLPKLKTNVLFREHIRTFPETQPVELAEKVVVLYYTTVADAKHRWPKMAEFDREQITQICSWVPTEGYYDRILPPFLRGRWNYKENGVYKQDGDMDEWIMFYYQIYSRATPEHQEGAEVVLSGAFNGTILYKGTLSAEVEEPTGEGGGARLVKRVMDIPISQLTPRPDPDGRDPMGRPYIELFGGAIQFRSSLFQSYGEILERTLHSERYMAGGSPVQEYQIQDSRATGVPIPVPNKDALPFYPEQAPIPPSLLDAIKYMDEEANSIASLTDTAQGNERAKEVSGVARRIAVQQARIGLNSMGMAVDLTACRRWRILLQLAQRFYETPQMLKYVGEDGQTKEVEYRGCDFALIGDVVIRQGTGTRQTPEGKVEMIIALKNEGLMSPVDAERAAKSSYATDLGMDDNIHEQYIERCVDTWLQGAPDGWLEENNLYQQKLAAYQAQIAPLEQTYQMAQMDAQEMGLIAPPPEVPPPPQAPWTPFMPRPNDDDIDIAIMWKRKLSEVMSSVKYMKHPPEWRDVLNQKYLAASQTMAAMAQPVPTNPGPNAEEAPQDSQGQAPQ